MREVPHERGAEYGREVERRNSKDADAAWKARPELLYDGGQYGRGVTGGGLTVRNAASRALGKRKCRETTVRGISHDESAGVRSCGMSIESAARSASVGRTLHTTALYPNVWTHASFAMRSERSRG